MHRYFDLFVSVKHFAHALWAGETATRRGKDNSVLDFVNDSMRSLLLPHNDVLILSPPTTVLCGTLSTDRTRSILTFLAEAQGQDVDPTMLMEIETEEQRGARGERG